ncbi:efflux transporter outer membrane subunit [Acerihabitans sp. TG2]|uniref:efflux transporter outer membrane subunit n=1 Tax=Acerihabitans sp. TG2 TaxID=3096008 RepID=UPI002B226848|nr:efflux transporter outer membrane subunit [Acerihabitans sp. TG2]MEA9391563.1 efflux transporter outer membrane subunit [Acerihabitans sp. TG2]
MSNPVRSLSVSAVVVSALLTGCTLQPDYHRPALPVVNHWEQSTKGPQSMPNVVDTGWQQFFTDPEMRQLIILALTNNRDLKVAVLNVEKARAQYRIDRAALLPTIDATASQTSAHLPGGLYSTQSTGPATYHQYEGGLGVTSWELDFFGKLRSLKDEGLESYLSSAATQQATQISLISDVATGYLTLCSDNDLLKLAEQTMQSQQGSYDLTKRSYDYGVSTSQDLAQAETTVRAAQADVAKYTRQVKQDLDALTLLVGAALPTSVMQNAKLDNNWHFPATPVGLPSDLLARRPDIIAAEHTLKAANANIGAARAAFFPSISLTTSGGSASSSLDHLFSAGTANWSFVPSVSIPIFDGGVNSANLDIAKLSKRIEVANYEQAIEQAFKDVADSLAGQATYKDELSARQLDTAANQRNYDLSTLRFHAGVDNFLNVLVAQRELYSAQQSEITTHLGLLNQQITLYKALGGGWKQ